MSDIELDEAQEQPSETPIATIGDPERARVDIFSDRLVARVTLDRIPQTAMLPLTDKHREIVVETILKRGFIASARFSGGGIDSNNHPGGGCDITFIESMGPSIEVKMNKEQVGDFVRVVKGCQPLKTKLT